MPSPANNKCTHHGRSRGLHRRVPILSVAKNYSPAWLAHDIGAGLVLTAVLVPVGIGYAAASGLPAIYGLYATIIPLAAYAIFGPSRILVLGPDSALSGLIAATILPLAAGDASRAAALAGMLAVLSGTICIFAGLARFGFITDLLSTPIRTGYLNGIAVTVLIGQMPKLLGFSVEGSSFIEEAGGLARGILDGKINATACAIGVSCLAVILAFKRWAPKIPGILFAVIGATAAVSALDLSSVSGIAVIGPLPRGLPGFTPPHAALADLGTLFPAAVAIALVSFSDMSTISRAFAYRSGSETDSNQEIIALGAANFAAGFFMGFPVSSSASRTPVAESAGAKTQVTGLVGALCIALLLVFAPNLLSNMPHAALGAIVIAACLSLVEIGGVTRLYRLRREEFFFSLVCFLGVVLLGVVQGIFMAVTLALLAFIWRAWQPHDAVLGHVAGLNSYHDVRRHPEAVPIPGMVIFRWDAPLFFANAEIFRRHVLHIASRAPEPVRWFVIAAEPITDIDVTAADILDDLDKELHRMGMDLFFAELKGPVKDRLKHYGLFKRIGEDNFFPTIEQAVQRYLGIFKVDWPPRKK